MGRRDASGTIYDQRVRSSERVPVGSARCFADNGRDVPRMTRTASCADARPGRRYAPVVVTLAIHGILCALVLYLGAPAHLARVEKPVEIEFLASPADDRSPTHQPDDAPAAGREEPAGRPQATAHRSARQRASRATAQRQPTIAPMAPAPAVMETSALSGVPALAGVAVELAAPGELLPAPSGGPGLSGSGRAGADGTRDTRAGRRAPTNRARAPEKAPIRSRARPPRLIYPRRDRPEREGEVFVVLLMIDKDGYVDGVRLKQGVSPHQDEKALNAIWRFRYDPARDDAGQPIAARIEQRFMLE